MTTSYARPAEGTLTRRVWDIADEETRREGRLASRARVIERVVAEGGNFNTASTQYHHWRNAQAGVREGTADNGVFAGRPTPVRLDVTDAGRVLLPADLRAALGVQPGDQLFGEIVDGELRLMSRDTSVRKAQELVRKYVPDEVGLVDELLAERHAEVEREDAQARESA